ncbi:tigger transposable element-derived protein 1-like [Palaemon carinicauda]|uniref:tigger transposable element-derived protein 1-like n=1 Tax=Palaemon carinicauda TaxID=392227 RepID=UPI0035B5C83A
MTLNTTQYSRSFIPAMTKLWNDLPNHVVETDELQKFKLAGNVFMKNRPMGPKIARIVKGRSRKMITMKMKLEIIKKYEEGMLIVTLDNTYGRNQSTIGTIIKNNEAIKAIISHKASAIFADLVEAQRDSGGKGTSQQALQESKASHAWFDRFRKMTGIHSVVRHGEAASSDKKAAEEFLKNFENSNAKAWVTRTIFIEWINVCFSPGVKNYLEENDLPLKCLLVLDNAPAHPLGLENIIHPHFSFIKVLYLLPNTTPLLQPMDQQVIANFKKLYTKHLFRRCFEVTESTQLTLHEFWMAHFDIVQCLKMINIAWNEVSRRTLNSSWKKLWPVVGAEGDFESFDPSTEDEAVDDPPPEGDVQ